MAFPDSKTEEEGIISPEIAELIGVQDGFDLDYDDYMQLLKKAIVESKMGGRKLTDEQLAMIANERKRIRDKKDSKFQVKKQKFIEFVAPSKGLISPSKLKPPTPQADQPGQLARIEGQEKKDNLLDLVSSIRKSVEDICDILKKQNEILIKSNEDLRKKNERRKRGEREDKLEKRDNKLLNTAKKMLAPMESIFDKIWRFIFFTLLGRLMIKMLNWMADPKNKEKLESIGRFLKDWWPALLGAWFLFANPLGIFIRKTIGTVLKLTLKLAKFAIPKLLGFIKKNPKAAAAVALFTAGYTIPKMFPGTVDAEEKKTEKAPGTKEEKISALRKQKENLNFFDKLQGKGSEIDEQLHFLETGETKGYGFAKGGEIFSGVVDKDTGTRVRGAGEDTQFLPSTDGTGVLVAPGEIVMNQDQQQKMYDDTGVHPMSYVANARPKKHKGFTAVSTGGILSAFKSGGIIGGSSYDVKKGTEDIDTPAFNFNPNFVIDGLNDYFKEYQKKPNNTILPSFKDYMNKSEYKKYLGSKFQKSKVFTYSNDITNNILPQQLRDISFKTSNVPDFYNKYYKNKPKKQSIKDQLLDLRRMRANSLERQGRHSEAYGLRGFSLPSGTMNNIIKTGFNNNYNFAGVGTNPINVNFADSFLKHGPIKENTGKDVPGATADRQLVRVQPGEFNYIIPKDAVKKGAVEKVNSLVAQLDPNSTPADKGKRKVDPPSAGKPSLTVLPPVKTKSGSSTPSAGNKTGSKVPDFSVISPSSIPNRIMISEIYGIE
jgi:hypothetical protein